MKTLNLDLETFSPENLTKTGTYKDEPQKVATPDTCAYCLGHWPCPTVRAIQDAIGGPQ